MKQPNRTEKRIMTEGDVRTHGSRERTHLWFVAGSFDVGNADGFYALHLRPAKRTKFGFQFNQLKREAGWRSFTRTTWPVRL